MPLYQNIAAVVASIQGSTCALDYPDLPAAVELHLNAAAGRASAAAERSRERSAGIREAIRKASAPLPMNQPEHVLVAVVDRRLRAHPSAYGLEHGPSVKVIRDEIRTMQETGNFGTEATISLAYASTIRST